MTASAFACGILANLATLLATILITLLWYVIFGRRALMKFFGVTRGKLLRIYVGHVWSPQADGLVGFEEMNRAKDIEALFKSLVPGFDGMWRGACAVGGARRLCWDRVNAGNLTLSHAKTVTVTAGTIVH